MGYHFEKYCKDYENIENYEKAKADNFKCWCCHHRLETYTSYGERRLVDITKKELKALGMYWHRPAEELIFMTTSEHSRLHMKGNQHSKGKKKSEETKNKLREAHKGKHLSEETKNKIAEASKGKKFSEEHRNNLSIALNGKMKGMCWYNNGKINKRAKECPDGFTPGLLRK